MIYILVNRLARYERCDNVFPQELMYAGERERGEGDARFRLRGTYMEDGWWKVVRQPRGYVDRCILCHISKQTYYVISTH